MEGGGGGSVLRCGRDGNAGEYGTERAGHVWRSTDGTRTEPDRFRLLLWENDRARARRTRLPSRRNSATSSPRGHARRHRGSSASLLPQRSPPLTRDPDLPTTRLVPTRLSTTVATYSILLLYTRDVHIILLLLRILLLSKLYYCTKMVTNTYRIPLFLLILLPLYTTSRATTQD